MRTRKTHLSMSCHRASPASLGEDIIRGAAAIAEFLYGSRSHRRQVYYLRERKQVPIFALDEGGQLWARKSQLVALIASREAEAV